MTGVGRHKIREWNVCVVVTDSDPPPLRAVVQTVARPEAGSASSPGLDHWPLVSRAVSSAVSSQQTALEFLLTCFLVLIDIL